METSCSVQRVLTTIPTSLSYISRTGFDIKAVGSRRFIWFSSSSDNPHTRKFRLLDFRAQASAIKAVSGAVEASPRASDTKEKDLAFVAGATGKVGSRTVRELLKLGFRVRAGVRSPQKAESLVQSVEQMRIENAGEGTQPVERLEIVECDLESRDRILPALGNASVVLCCIGASEKEITDITGPYRIDFQATENLINAATIAKVDHFILVTSLGTNKIGFPAALLNLFWGVLIWKRKAEEALMASGLPFTVVRPGGMERPTDVYKETHNVTLSQEDTLFGGQVSNLQVAELLACMAKNPGLSYCKIVEVIAETTAPLNPMEELLATIPSKRPYSGPPREPDTINEPDLAPSKRVIEGPEAYTGGVPTQKPVEPRPLSPYAVYDDLKPPTSPTPTPSTSPSVLKSITLVEPPKSSVEDEAIKAKEKKATPLSPYACYDDLKPPTSPTPTPPTKRRDPNAVGAAPSSTASDTEASVSKTETGPTEPAPTDGRQRPLSPYAAYEDLKPPTSPTPTPSTGKPASSSDATTAQDVSPLTGGNDVAETIVDGVKETGNNLPNVASAPGSSSSDMIQSPPAADKPGDGQPRAMSRQRPLSPYTMYEDMKPPTSPTPVPEKRH